MKLIVSMMAVAAATFFAVADDVLVLDESGRGETGRFRVLDHEGDALGLMVSAEEKFLAAASVARVSVDSSWIRVTIDCPVPEGMKVAKGVRNAWDGDGVELFIRPSIGKNVYYQYSANAAGVFDARRNWAPDVKDNNWRTAATATVSDNTNGFCVAFSVPFSEVFKETLKPGDVFGINFTRCGKTCSGMSTWAAVGSNFSNIDAFGMVVFGGGKAYFARRIDAVRAKSGAINASSAARNAIDRKIAEAAAAVEESGHDPSAFSRLEKTLADVEKSLISAKLSGKGVVMFRPNSPWGNRLAPTVEVSPLESLQIRSARNARALAVFAAANLTDEPFVGEFKVAAVPSEDAKDAKRRRALARHLSFSQGFAIADRVGRAIYDPTLPLPLNSLLRLAPNESVPIYVELDTHGLEAGTYRAELLLRKAMPGQGASHKKDKASSRLTKTSG